MKRKEKQKTSAVSNSFSATPSMGARKRRSALAEPLAHMPLNDSDSSAITHSMNVTSLNVTLVSLKQFSEYEVKVIACQDVNATENYCSPLSAREAVRTLPIRK